MNKYFSLISTLLVVMLLLNIPSCKEPDEITGNPPNRNDPLFQSFQMLQLAHQKFVEIGDLYNLPPRDAMNRTAFYMETQPGVEEVFFLDSTYLKITTTGGYQTTLAINEIDQNGMSIFRGSANGISSLLKFSGINGEDCENKIENKKVLLYSAHESDFYQGVNEYQTRVIDVIKNGDVDVDVTYLKNEQCTADIFETLDQYGLVILDTHGELNAVLTGTSFVLDSIDIPGTVDEFEILLSTKLGLKHYFSFIDKKLSLGYAYEYDPELQNQEMWDRYKQELDRKYTVSVTSKGIRELVPNLSNTIVFANCCYSAFTAASFSYSARRVSPDGHLGEVTTITINYDPVQPAWISRAPLAFYGYEAANQGMSYAAPNDFCKQNEDTLIHSFFYDGDSTGAAHLFNGTTISEFPFDRYIMGGGNFGPLRFNQYNQVNWCYGSCGDTILDIRDMRVYETVCIGDQVWMAENLNWAGAGVCYDNNTANCDTYGRLYTINELVNLDTSSTNPSGIRGICPEGWHVPSDAEWQELFDFCGVDAEKKLKSTTWPTPNQNTNELGFNMLPSGYFEPRGSDPRFQLIGSSAMFWSTSANSGIYIGISSIGSGISRTGFDQLEDWKLSCRCVKD